MPGAPVTASPTGNAERAEAPPFPARPASSRRDDAVPEGGPWGSAWHSPPRERLGHGVCLRRHVSRASEMSPWSLAMRCVSTSAGEPVQGSEVVAAESRGEADGDGPVPHERKWPQ